MQVHAVSSVSRLLGRRRRRVESAVVLSDDQRVRDGIPHGPGEVDSAAAEGGQSTGAQRLHDRRRNYQRLYFTINGSTTNSTIME